jgi:hypothetical protein
MSEVVSDPNEVPSGNEAKNSVSYETHKRLLEQRKKDQVEKEALAVKLSEFEAEKARLEEEKLRQEGNWKSLVESRELKLKAIEEENKLLATKAKQYEQTLADAVKLNAFQNKLGGKLKKSEYLTFVDTNRIPIDPDTKTVDDKAVEQYAHEFSNQFKELISFDRGGSLPGGAAQPGKQLSVAEWQKLPLKEQKARLKEVVPNKNK